ncbi:MAG: hypothetical protein WD426_08335 [Anditalea sp.]
MNWPILIDTSVWIDYITGRIDKRTDLLYNHIAKNHPTLICLIAHYAIFHHVPLLHNDADFDLIASKANLKVTQP